MLQLDQKDRNQPPRWKTPLNVFPTIFPERTLNPLKVMSLFFSKFLASELVKIQDDDIKRSVKRKLTEVIFDAVEEDAQKQKQQQQHVQYMLLGDGSLHPLVHIPES